MQYTTNYNLRKPEDNDYYDIADQNANMDTLDSEIKQIENNALTTSSAINYTTPDSYTAPASGNNIPTLFGRITKGLSDLFTNLAAKLDSSKIIASTNITQAGYVMDGKTCADALTQLNSNYNVIWYPMSIQSDNAISMTNNHLGANSEIIYVGGSWNINKTYADIPTKVTNGVDVWVPLASISSETGFSIQNGIENVIVNPGSATLYMSNSTNYRQATGYWKIGDTIYIGISVGGFSGNNNTITNISLANTWFIQP